MFTFNLFCYYYLILIYDSIFGRRGSAKLLVARTKLKKEAIKLASTDTMQVQAWRLSRVFVGRGRQT